MKKQFSLMIMLASSLIMLAGCNGPSNEEEDDKPVEGLRISVDKTEATADGVDKVTFTVTNALGVDLTQTDPRPVRIVEKQTQESLGTRVFSETSYENRSVEYIAMYGSQQSVNSVTVNFVGREEIEKYYQNVLLIEGTGTWCISCPQVVTALERIASPTKDHMIVMALHITSQNGYDPYTPVNNRDLGYDLLATFPPSEVPACVCDFHTRSGAGSIPTISTLINDIEAQIINHPATCGVKINSSSLNNGTVEINASVISDKGGSYTLAWAVLADDIYYPQGTISDGIYNDVVIAASNTFGIFDAEKAVTLGANEEHTASFSVSGLPTEEMDSSSLRIVVWANVADSESPSGARTDNATVAPLGQSNDYMLN